MSEKKENSIPLPEAFCERMRTLLGQEYEAFMETYEKERSQGLRLNPLRFGLPDEKLIEQFGLRPIPWTKDGYYYEAETRPGRHPYHEAGLYYIQEPSAMAAAEVLEPKPGEKVLDLCAAPGGKSTQIAGMMEGRGLLVSNEIHPERARILSQNIERMGIGNAVVTNETPERLSGFFREFFDRILVDAPCSGEGMFRKDQEARREWSPENVALCARRQAGILDCAAQMLRPGGRLVYSTCTFSPEENEENIRGFLARHPDFAAEKVKMYEGFSAGELEGTIRIWPHKADGEGHFIAVLRKDGADTGTGPEKISERKKKNSGSSGIKDKSITALWEAFCADTLNGNPADAGRLLMFGEQLYLLPEPAVDFRGLKVLRPGLHLGPVKRNRLEPSHALALWLRKEQVKRWYLIPAESPDMERYLRGETLEVRDDCEVINGGWVLMLADGYSIGWAKLVGRTLKNHYPKGLRKN